MSRFNSTYQIVRAVFSTACLFMVLVLTGQTAQAQFVEFRVTTEPRVAFVNPEPIDMTRIDQKSVVTSFDRSGRLLSLKSGACLPIGAPENITVLVQLTIEDEHLNESRGRPLEITAYYINDRGGCPETIEMAMGVSQPFYDDGSAQFRLSSFPQIARNLVGSERFFIAYVYLTVRQEFDNQAGAVGRRQDMEYRGRYILDIVYL